MVDATFDESSRYWTEFWEQSTRSGKNRGPMQPTFWDRMAGRYKENTPAKRAEQRLKMIFNLIESTGLDFTGAEVLDIGAGTGSLSIPLARKGANVTAVDFSAKMLARLEDRAAREDISLAQTLLASWDEIDLDAEGFRGQFDLVIASMTPAVRCPGTFNLMLEAAKGVCYYSGWVNREWDPAYYELHRLLFNDDFRGSSYGFSFPVMDLYLKGYRPAIRIIQEEWKAEESVSDMVDMVSGFFSAAKDLNEEMKGYMEEYFRARAKNGKYLSKTTATTGMMVWDMQKKDGGL